MPFRSDRLQDLRKAKGWSKDELAERAGLSRPMITKTENSKNLPRSEALDKLAQALDCTADYLLGRGPEYQTPEAAAAHMAFEVARSSLTNEQSERCRRVLQHSNAPRTAGAWLDFAEKLTLAIGPQTAILAFVKRGPKPATGRRPRRNSGTT